MGQKLIREMIAIVIGGGIGSVLRFILSRWIQDRTQTAFFPWGILSVNLIGCLLIGILFGIFVENMNTGPIFRAGIFIGLLGGFTTFSSFSLDAISLLYSGAYGAATLYIIISVFLGILATVLGLSLVKIIF